MQVAVNAFHGLAKRKIPSLDKKLGNMYKVFLPYPNVAVTWQAARAASLFETLKVVWWVL